MSECRDPEPGIQRNSEEATRLQLSGLGGNMEFESVGPATDRVSFTGGRLALLLPS